jgi:H/ACA ribonucleoprotein complex non-core subunit NAF1
MSTEERPYDDGDSLYGSDSAENVTPMKHDESPKAPKQISPPAQATSPIPGLGLLYTSPPALHTRAASTNNHFTNSHHDSMNLGQVNQDAVEDDFADIYGDTDDLYDQQAGTVEESRENVATTVAESNKPKAETSSSKYDKDFLETAEANKDDLNAEWRFDPSDADSSDSSGSSSSDEDSSEEEDDSTEGYQLLSPEEQAHILMQDVGDDDGAAEISGPLRTINERAEEIPPKPQIEVSTDTQITKLGQVENIVEGKVVIKADTSADYKILKFGSAICLEDRTVIGAVMDTLCSVRAPRYTVGFANPDEITQLGITGGTTIYFVNEHSTFLFTEDVRGIKGTDASNFYDEEAQEVEFSDDEKEVEYKRSLKQAKQARKEARNGAATSANCERHPDSMSLVTTRTGINYDNEEDPQMYHRLPRPDNLHRMTPLNEPIESTHNRHGSRGRGRQRGGRGRGFRDTSRGSSYGRHNDNYQRNGRDGHPQSASYQFHGNPVTGQFPYSGSPGTVVGSSSFSAPSFPENVQQASHVQNDLPTAQWYANLQQHMASGAWPYTPGQTVQAPQQHSYSTNSAVNYQMSQGTQIAHTHAPQQSGNTQASTSSVLNGQNVNTQQALEALLRSLTGGSGGSS